MSDRSTVYSEALPQADADVRCQLVVIEGPDQGRAVRIEAAPLIVGTGADSSLVLRDDRVSERHLSLKADAGRFTVVDLESTNGTLYEGSRVGMVTVPVGATFKVGRSFLRILPIRAAMEVEPSSRREFGDLVGESLALREVFALLELAARSDVTVLLEGETGTGKELAARGLHEEGPRRKGPFVAVDCGALPENLLESELFGHVRGAFTGASAERKGAFARADGGTIFLDELAAISPAVQARLLRVVEERRFLPVGSDRERSVDVRIVGAAREDLEAKVAEGSFRPDLYYRLSVVRVVIPPLRLRREDIAPIVSRLLARRGIAPGPIQGTNYHQLYTHDWPGNVRQLRNVIERAIALSPGAQSFAELRLALAEPAASGELLVRTDLHYTEAKEVVLHAFERRYLREIFERAGRNISAASRESGLDRKHLRTLLLRHGLIVREAEDS